MEHTQTPWLIACMTSGVGVSHEITTLSGQRVAATGSHFLRAGGVNKFYTQIYDNSQDVIALSHANAEFIVTACNSYSENIKRAEAAEARVAQLEADLATARADIVRYQDERVKLLGRSETLVVDLEHAQATAKSNGEMWAECNRQREISDQEMLEASELIRELREKNEQLQSEINYLRSTDHAADIAFERMSPIDWRYDETPLGQALDGQGDEVEP